MSKASHVASPAVSPPVKRVKITLLHETSSSKRDMSMPPLAHRYSVGSKPSSFIHLLNESLLLQTIDGHASKTIDQILVDAAGHTFHVLQDILLVREVYAEKLKSFLPLQAEHGECAEKMLMLDEEADLSSRAG